MLQYFTTSSNYVSWYCFVAENTYSIFFSLWLHLYPVFLSVFFLNKSCITAKINIYVYISRPRLFHRVTTWKNECKTTQDSPSRNSHLHICWRRIYQRNHRSFPTQATRILKSLIKEVRQMVLILWSRVLTCVQRATSSAYARGSPAREALARSIIWNALISVNGVS